MTDRACVASLSDQTPVGKLPLRPATIDALRVAGVLTLEELRTMGDRELRRLRRFGPVALADVRFLVPAPEKGASAQARRRGCPRHRTGR